MHACGYLFSYISCLTSDWLPILCYALWAIQGCVTLWPSICIICPDPTLLVWCEDFEHITTENMSQMPEICQLIHVQIWDNYVRKHTSYELNAIKNVTRSIGIHTFDINGKYPWVNMPDTLDMYFLINFCCSPHTDATLLHISTKINKLQQIFTILVQNMGQQQIYPSNATNMVHGQVTLYVFMADVWQKTCHIWSCSL